MQDSATLQVLIADAAAGDRAALADALRAADSGLTTFEAAEGAEALAILEREPIDLCFVARTLPGAKGPAVLRWVRDRGPGCVFVLTSDELMPSWPAIARHIQAYEVLLKPPRDGVVKNLIRAVRCMRDPGRLLVAEGSGAVRGLLARMLAQSRFRFAPSEFDLGRDAVNMAGLQHYRVALVDMALPDLKGLEAASQVIARSPATRVIVTGTADPLALKAALPKLGIAAYLQKPFDLAALDDAFHEALGLWRPYLTKALRAA